MRKHLFRFGGLRLDGHVPRPRWLVLAAAVAGLSREHIETRYEDIVSFTGLAEAMGLFINTLPLRIRLGGRSVQECLQETHAGLTGLMHHEHATLSLAQRCSGVDARTPLFSALLNYRHSVAASTSDAGALQIPEGITAEWGQTPCKRALDEDRTYIEDVSERWGDMPIVRERMDNVELNCVLSNSFGFGGTNAALMFKRYTS